MLFRSWAVATCLFWAAVLSVTFPRLVGALGVIGAFGFYAGLNVCALVMIFFLMPGTHIFIIAPILLFLTNHFSFLKKKKIETKQRTLEELDYVFAVPTSRHVSYQAKTFLPYWIRRYIFFRNVELEPLYNFDEVESVTVFEKGVGH